MNATDLADSLQELGRAYVEGGLRKTPPSLAVLIKDLRVFESSAIADVKASLAAGKIPKKQSARVPKPKPIPNAEIVKLYLESLLAASNNEDAFAQACAQLEADKRVRPAQELREILSTYSDGSLTGKTKLQRLQLLKTAFHQRLRAKQNEEIAAKSSPV